MTVHPDALFRYGQWLLLVAGLLFHPGFVAAEGTSSEKRDDKNAAYPPDYIRLLEQAVERFDKRDFPATLRKLDEADGIVRDTPEALNVRGAIAIEQKRFEDGKRYCEEALKKHPGFFPAKFNLGEIPFLQKDYLQARGIYWELLRENPGNELVQYRVFMTYLLEKNDESAKKALNRIRFPGETGAYYYAKAAWELAHGHKEEAMKWIQSGDSLASREKNTNFADVFYDLGWLERPKDGK